MWPLSHISAVAVIVTVFLQASPIAALPPLHGIVRPLGARVEAHGLSRRASQDPSCPSGFLCIQTACPNNVICPVGYGCVNFEGTLACATTGLKFCSLNPTTFEAVGCNGGSCCHGNCYVSDALQIQRLINQYFFYSQHKLIHSCYRINRFGLYNCNINFLGPHNLIEKCVAFAQKGAWRYAGLENGSVCYVGNTLHNATEASSKDCNQVCAGNSTELCGAMSRVQAYNDSSWFFPDLVQLKNAFLQLNSSLGEALEAINDYRSDLQQLQTQGSSKNAKVVRDVPSNIFQSLKIDGNTFRLARSAASSSAATVSRYAGIAAADDIELEPLLADEASSLADQTLGSLETVVDREVASIDSNPSAPTIDVPGDLAAIDPQIQTIGIPGIVTAGAGAATGIFLSLLLLLSIGTSSPPPPQSSSIGMPTSTIVTTASSTSTTTTCSPTMSPTPMVVLTQKNTSDDDANDLINSLPKGALVDQDSYPSIGYLALLVEIDNCDAGKLLASPNVASVSLNAEIDDPTEIEDDGAIGTVSPDTLSNLSHTNVSEAITKRGISVATEFYFEQSNSYNYHLGWLSSPWARNQVPAQSVQNFDGFLYDNATAEDPDNQVYIYVIDKGIAPTNQVLLPFRIEKTVSDMLQEFDYRPVQNLDSFFNSRTGGTARSDVRDDSTGHGTRMASLAAGYYFGVAKMAKLVIVKVSGFTGPRTTLWELVKGIAYSAHNVVDRGLSGRAVFSMSIAFEINTLFWDSDQVVGSPEINPFPWLFNEYIYPAGVTAVAAGHNDITEDLAAFEPQARGGSETGLTVVGNADANGARYIGEDNKGSSILDTSRNNILSIYAMGVKACGGTTDYGSFICFTGCSPATAQVAGLAAYFLSKPTIRAQMTSAGPSEISKNVKQYLIAQAVEQKGLNWGTATEPDTVPRAAMNEFIGCTEPTGQPTQPEREMPGDTINTFDEIADIDDPLYLASDYQPIQWDHG
ncbi:uncharacterized protein TRIVIDRAFT_203489 [Trichoderma virens Gv29-8]|uniref:WSC domain-containing protein n=1 Tax=Hypocrea virens (strain Gv29-8 / FGSC 10586) TaxID=413071 RepID=G9N0Q9_HYPVG|nr:uncharacterized protein TRIVIDRAFT_203489 [Trichoderma virens Gv29-8]EHK19941.1 hypothetical protein TRIVIDRAFT_203489 [Trichoderma virens Gv29-8]